MMAIRSEEVNCVADKFLRGVESPELIRRRHRGHVEVESEQAVVAVAWVPGRFRRDLRARELLVGRGARRDAGEATAPCWTIREFLEFEEPNGLRDSVLGDGEIFGRKVVDRVAGLCLSRLPFRPPAACVLLNVAGAACAARARANKRTRMQIVSRQHLQNLSRRVVCTLAHGIRGRRQSELRHC